MPYRYLAYDSTGAEKRGVLQVELEETAEQILYQRGLTIANLTKTKAGFDLVKWFPTYFGPKARDVIVFSNQLANLVESGVGLLTGLDLMAEEVTSKSLQKVLTQVVDDIRQGSAISTALSKHKYVFPPIYQHPSRKRAIYKIQNPRSYDLSCSSSVIGFCGCLDLTEFHFAAPASSV